jgi:5-formyltetrahydrofolate cyclo-ligase
LQVNTSLAKARLRRQALERRSALGPEVRAAFSAKLKSESVALAALHDARAVSAFHPIRDEPDTLALLDALAQRGHVTALPITGARGQALTFRVWRPDEPTIPGPFGIPEPGPEAPLVEPHLLFVPMAVFDRSGQRIGYGAGYYDRTLAMLRSKRRTIAVGVAYSVCEVETVPAEPHDQALDYILTEIELVKVAR